MNKRIINTIPANCKTKYKMNKKENNWDAFELHLTTRSMTRQKTMRFLLKNGRLQ